MEAGMHARLNRSGFENYFIVKTYLAQKPCFPHVVLMDLAIPRLTRLKDQHQICCVILCFDVPHVMCVPTNTMLEKGSFDRSPPLIKPE